MTLFGTIRPFLVFACACPMASFLALVIYMRDEEDNVICSVFVVYVLTIKNWMSSSSRLV